MLDWLWNNKDWFFSGAGITALALLYWVFKKVFFGKKGTDRRTSINLGPTISQAPLINQSPVVNITNSFTQPARPNQDDSGPDKPLPAIHLPEKGGRPDLFTLPAGIEDLSMQSFHGAAEQFNRDHITTYLARFKLAANDRDGVGHELTATVEYVDKVRVPKMRYPMERLVLRVGQAR